jgi:rod shape-determining protein MreC
MSFLRKYQPIIIVCALVVIFLITLTLISKSSLESGFLRRLVVEIVVPLENAVNSSSDRVGRAWQRYIFLVGLEDENRRLKREVAELTGRMNEYHEAYLESSRLKKLLDLTERTGLDTMAAKVVGRERVSVFKTILINKGSSDGLKIGLSVMAPEGAVGRIVDVSWNISKVLLLSDYNSNIDALVQSVRAHGILQGAGNDGCVLKYVQRSEDVRVGDAVICSGLAGVFPKGLLLGTVIGVNREQTELFQKITVAPAVNVSKVEEVMVILKKTETE